VIVIVGALFTSVGLASAQQATSSALVESPMAVRDASIGSDEATIALGQGEQDRDSLVASAGSVSLTVWTKRTPCFAEDENQCVESESQRSRSTETFSDASMTLTPRSSTEDRTVLVLEEDGTLNLAVDDAGIGVDEEETEVRFSDEPEAPAGVNEARIPDGVSVATEATNASLEGPIRLQTAGTVLQVEDNASADMRRTIETGYSWEESESDGFTADRVVRLVRVEAQGVLTLGWQGEIQTVPDTPVTVDADQARFNVTEGEVAGVTPANGTAEVSDFQATITGYDANEDGPLLEVEQGVAPANTPATDGHADEDSVSSTTLYGAGSAALVTVGLVAYYWPRLSWAAAVGVMPLYSRIEKDELFENEVRERLYETIQDDPGVHAHALADEADIGWGTTVYHLRRLERNGFVKSEKRGRYRRFFPASGFMEQQREVLSVLQNETTRDIAQVVRGEPGLNQSAICDDLDISPSLANWHLNRLIDAELVDRERQGRTVHYTPGEAWDALEQAVDVEVDEVLGEPAAA